jgi:hypothetical protein
MKKTAVEWFFKKLNENQDKTYKEIELIFEQAKEMEKEQHGKTWDTALDKYEVRAGNYMRAYEDFDEYYNETYKSEQ